MANVAPLRLGSDGLIEQFQAGDTVAAASVETGTSGAKIPLLSTANTFTLAQTFTVAPFSSLGMDLFAGSPGTYVLTRSGTTMQFLSGGDVKFIVGGNTVCSYQGTSSNFFDGTNLRGTFDSIGLTVQGVIKIGASQVITARQTGWAAATGTATRTSFATSTVTTAALAQAVKALIDDLITHGLIGA